MPLDAENVIRSLDRDWNSRVRPIPTNSIWLRIGNDVYLSIRNHTLCHRKQSIGLRRPGLSR